MEWLEDNEKDYYDSIWDENDELYNFSYNKIIVEDKKINLIEEKRKERKKKLERILNG